MGFHIAQAGQSHLDQPMGMPFIFQPILTAPSGYAPPPPGGPSVTPAPAPSLFGARPLLEESAPLPSLPYRQAAAAPHIQRIIQAAALNTNLDVVGTPTRHQAQAFQTAHHQLDSPEGSLMEEGNAEESREPFPEGPPPEIPVWPAQPIVATPDAVATLDRYFQPAPPSMGTAGVPTVAELGHIPRSSWATDCEDMVSEEEANRGTDGEAPTVCGTDSDIANLQASRRQRSARHRHSPYESTA